MPPRPMSPTQARFVLALPGIVLLGVALGLSIGDVHDMLTQSIVVSPNMAVAPTLVLTLAVIWGLGECYIARSILGRLPLLVTVTVWAGLHLTHGLQHSPDTTTLALAQAALAPAAAAVVAIVTSKNRTGPHPGQENTA